MCIALMLERTHVRAGTLEDVRWRSELQTHREANVAPYRCDRVGATEESESRGTTISAGKSIGSEV